MTIPAQTPATVDAAGIGTPETATMVTAEPQAPKKRTFFSQLRASLAMFANPKSAAGLIILGIFVLVAIFAPLIAPYDPTAQHLDHTLEPPSWQFPLGTTHIGEDVFSQIIYGTRGVLVVGFLATITSWADKELKAYRHVDLAPGAEETVELEVPVADCTIVDATGARIVEPGAFELLIGSSSRDEDLRSVSFTVAAA